MDPTTSRLPNAMILGWPQDQGARASRDALIDAATAGATVAWEGGVRCLSAWQYPTLHYGNRAVVALPLSVHGRGVAGGAGPAISGELTHFC